MTATGYVMAGDAICNQARSTALALRELHCSRQLIAFELRAKFGLSPRDAKTIARNAFHPAEDVSAEDERVATIGADQWQCRVRGSS